MNLIVAYITTFFVIVLNVLRVLLSFLTICEVRRRLRVWYSMTELHQQITRGTIHLPVARSDIDTDDDVRKMVDAVNCVAAIHTCYLAFYCFVFDPVWDIDTYIFDLLTACVLVSIRL
jgi:hypothetical protein